MMDEHERRWMEQQAALLAEAKVLKEAVKNFSHGELLSLYVILEKMGVAAGSDFIGLRGGDIALQGGEESSPGWLKMVL